VGFSHRECQLLADGELWHGWYNSFEYPQSFFLAILFIQAVAWIGQGFLKCRQVNKMLAVALFTGNLPRLKSCGIW
jgi:hypothetical protein